MSSRPIYRRPYPHQVIQKRLLRRTFLAGASSGTTFFQTVTGIMTPSGALSTTLVVLQSVAGSMTPAGLISRQTNKAVSGSVALAGDITKQISKTVGGSMTPEGLLLKQIQTSLTGSVTLSGTLEQFALISQAASGALAGLAGALVTQLLAPPVIQAGINKVRGWYGRHFGRS